MLLPKQCMKTAQVSHSAQCQHYIGIDIVSETCYFGPTANLYCLAIHGSEGLFEVSAFTAYNTSEGMLGAGPSCVPQRLDTSIYIHTQTHTQTHTERGDLFFLFFTSCFLMLLLPHLGLIKISSCFTERGCIATFITLNNGHGENTSTVHVRDNF